MPWDESLVNSLKVKDPSPEDGRVLGYSQALHEALSLALTRDPSVIVLGQGVDDPSAMFGVTRDLHLKFGRSRVFDTPVSEEGMTGICVGAAMSGLRPVFMHNRPDFLLLAMNQIVTHASKMHYMDNGQTTVPMVVWAAIGRGWGSGAQHSQAVQGLLMGVPGLKIIMPSNPYDAKGLMLSAIEDNNPVFIFEHRWVMRRKGIIPQDYYKIPIGKGAFLKRGKDITVVGASHAIQLALEASELPGMEEISAEIIDLRTIKPLDEEMILESVRKTGRVLVVDTGWKMAGVSAEIGCMVAEKAFHWLKAPVARVALPDSPTPAGFTLEQFYYPTAEKIAWEMKRLD